MVGGVCFLSMSFLGWFLDVAVVRKLGKDEHMDEVNERTCDRCQSFQRVIPINNPDEWEPILLAILEAIKRGTLRITDGRLTWDDLIDCELRCTHCGQCFKVEIETYRGRGGYVRPIQ